MGPILSSNFRCSGHKTICTVNSEIHECRYDVVLGLEIMIERPDRYPAGFGDIPDTRIKRPLFDEKLCRRLHYLPFFFAVGLGW